MKLALSNLAWHPADEEAAIVLMKKYGFEGVEKAVSKPYYNYGGTPNIIAFQSLLHMVEPFNIFAGGRKNSVVGSEYDYCLTLLDSFARWARDFDTDILVFGAPKFRESGCFNDAVQTFRYCAKNRIPLCIEPNPPQYGCNFITNTKEAQELIAAVNHPNFRLHLDSGIMTLNGETDIPADIAHFHISQPYLAPVGPGTVDHIAMAAKLREIDYKGWCSVEMLPCADLEKSLEYVAGIYGD